MKDYSVKLAGVTFLLYALLKLVGGVLNIINVTSTRVSFTGGQIFNILLVQILFPIIVVIISVVSCFIIKKRKSAMILYVLSTFYWIYALIGDVFGCITFFHYVTESNWSMIVIFIGYIIDLVFVSFNILASIIMIVCIGKIAAKKSSYLYVGASILMTIGIIVLVIKYAIYLVSPSMTMDVLAIIITVAYNALFVVGTFLLGYGFNMEMKNNINLQE